jgi:putative restriction endonuclease
MPEDWTRQQMLVALSLYWQIPFGRFDQRNPEIIQYAGLIGRTPSALAMRLSNWASLDPELKSRGVRGLPNISKAAKVLWFEAHENWDRFTTEAEQAAEQLGITDPVGHDVPESLDRIPDFTGGARAAQVMIRIGQDLFRRAVLKAYRSRCCITGLASPSLLVASHIVPWRIDASNRLNPRNGLCLSVLHDRAFDAGIITILEDMTVHVARNSARSAGGFFESSISAYEGRPISLPDEFGPDPEFLSYHRQHVFQG